MEEHLPNIRKAKSYIKKRKDGRWEGKEGGRGREEGQREGRLSDNLLADESLIFQEETAGEKGKCSRSKQT